MVQSAVAGAPAYSNITESHQRIGTTAFDLGKDYLYAAIVVLKIYAPRVQRLISGSDLEMINAIDLRPPVNDHRSSGVYLLDNTGVCGDAFGQLLKDGLRCKLCLIGGSAHC